MLHVFYQYQSSGIFDANIIYVDRPLIKLIRSLIANLSLKFIVNEYFIRMQL